jgi:hypothetical protein
VEPKPISGRLPSVGVDFGLNNLVALSDGTTIEAPRCYRKLETRSRKAHRNLSRKKKGSRNRVKARIMLAKVEEKIANQRRDFTYKTARMIINKYDAVYVEDLPVDYVPEEVCVLVPRRYPPVLLGRPVHQDLLQLSILCLSAELHAVNLVLLGRSATIRFSPNKKEAKPPTACVPRSGRLRRCP